MAKNYSNTNNSNKNTNAKNPSSVVVLGKFRRFPMPAFFAGFIKPRFFLYLQEIFNAPFGLFFIEKIWGICYNNSTL